MLTSAMIKEKAKELGATVCGIGKVYEEPNSQKDPRSILPNAKCIIGFGFAVPKGLYKAMEQGNQYYTYTTMGVKYIDEEMAEILSVRASLKDKASKLVMEAVSRDLGYGDNTTVILIEF